jgi:hypothetical protein
LVVVADGKGRWGEKRKEKKKASEKATIELEKKHLKRIERSTLLSRA